LRWAGEGFGNEGGDFCTTRPEVTGGGGIQAKRGKRRNQVLDIQKKTNPLGNRDNYKWQVGKKEK